MTESGGIQRMCDAPLDCLECMGYSKDIRHGELAQHVESGLYNSAAIELFNKLPLHDVSDRGRILREAAAGAGIEHCAWN